MAGFEKVVIIVQETWLDGLVAKYNTKQQAKFYIEHMGGSFSDYLDQHTKYYSALRVLKRSVPAQLKIQVVDKNFLPSFLFNDTDLVVVLGRDGLVINTTKYLHKQVVVGVNPDPVTIEGVLVQFHVDEIKNIFENIIDNNVPISDITMAQATLNTNQKLMGVNDIFIGHQSHQSARYTIRFNGEVEKQSSSGIIISTGVGSTGWYKSIISGALGMSAEFFGNSRSEISKVKTRFNWDAEELRFCVREPWVSKDSGNSIIFGNIWKTQRLSIESHMPEGGVIFSDGIEKDRIHFNSGTIAEITVSPKKVNLFSKVD